MGRKVKGSSQISADNEKQLRALFSSFDKDRDNHLNYNELKQAFKQLGAYFPCYRAWSALKVADSKRRDFIDFDDFDILVKYMIREGFKVNFESASSMGENEGPGNGNGHQKTSNTAQVQVSEIGNVSV